MLSSLNLEREAEISTKWTRSYSCMCRARPLQPHTSLYHQTLFFSGWNKVKPLKLMGCSSEAWNVFLHGFDIFTGNRKMTSRGWKTVPLLIMCGGLEGVVPRPGLPPEPSLQSNTRCWGNRSVFAALQCDFNWNQKYFQARSRQRSQIIPWIQA